MMYPGGFRAQWNTVGSLKGVHADIAQEDLWEEWDGSSCFIMLKFKSSLGRAGEGACCCCCWAAESGVPIRLVCSSEMLGVGTRDVVGGLGTPLFMGGTSITSCSPKSNLRLLKSKWEWEEEAVVELEGNFM